MTDALVEVPPEYRESHDAALRFSETPKLHRLFEQLLRDEKLRAKAVGDFDAVLRSQSVEVPDGLEVRFMAPSMPGPEWLPFSIRLLRCRKYYRKTRSGVEEADVCFGIEIIPNPVPGGPWGKPT